MSIPRTEHPRPDFRRENWLNLNGPWAFGFDDSDAGVREGWFAKETLPLIITVPFCYQSEHSGVEDKSEHPIVWYQRSFALPDAFHQQDVWLRFGAVDENAQCWVNGRYCGEHTGGFTSFEFNITHLLRGGDNTITLRVEDRLDSRDQPRGKQRWLPENFGCWYTPVTGIWQTVWLEARPRLFIEKVKVLPDADTGKLNLEVYLSGAPQGEWFEADVLFDGQPIASVKARAFHRTLNLSADIRSSRHEWGVYLWEPETPHLYDLTYTLGADRVHSYAGLRKIDARDGVVLLNNHPVYQRLILNQGYFDGGLYTAKEDEDYIRDINLIKSLGFNGLRMHQKAEDPRFYYWCDRLGMLVWGEMGSPYQFNDRMMDKNTQSWQEIIARDFNHPSIIVWTMMNESWGIPGVLLDKQQQAHATALYYMAKAYDPTRLVISNDGWEHTQSDIITFHDYMQDGEELAKKIADPHEMMKKPVASIGNSLGYKFLFAQGFGYQNQPILFSECCGTAFSYEQGWGYGEGVKTQEEFLERYQSLVSAIYSAKYLAGFCVTQFTDVGQEINGILRLNRQPKVDAEKFAQIIRGENRG